MSKESLENFLLPPKRGSIMYEFFFFNCYVSCLQPLPCENRPYPVYQNDLFTRCMERKLDRKSVV